MQMLKNCKISRNIFRENSSFINKVNSRNQELYYCSFFQLYFDLEYKISQNPRINGQDILTKFKNFIKRDLRTITCMESVKLDHIEILDMDSSTNEKFSHHLIGKNNHYIHFSTK